MHIVLWILQVLLAMVFFATGGMKLITPIPELLASGMTFVDHMPALLVRFIGAAEVAGALGLLLPAASRIAPKLTPIAASALTLVMILAVGTHLLLGEYGAVILPIALGSLAAFVAWGRFVKRPIAPRAESRSASPQRHAKAGVL